MVSLEITTPRWVEFIWGEAYLRDLKIVSKLLLHIEWSLYSIYNTIEDVFGVSKLLLHVEWSL